MPASRHRKAHAGFPTLATLALAGSLAACATQAPAPPALATDAQVTLEGRVLRVDTTPWTYDGNAVVELATDAHGTIALQFPARWNLCKAAPVGDLLSSLKPGDRVQAVATASGPREATVCEHASHRLGRATP